MSAVSLCFFLLGGCATNSERIDELAAHAHLRRSEIQVGSFKTVTYERRSSNPTTNTLVVFLEGDGVPWLRGVIPNTDPTTGDPLVLKLLIRSDVAGAYLSRPCYEQMKSETCTPDLWTMGRYSQQVVDVMVGAIEQLLERNQAKHVALIGFSGGGALAVLIAERVPAVETVVTLAANLDSDAWSAYHGYLPLSTSLNPAHSKLIHSFREIHLIGRSDAVVPSTTRAAYFERFPSAKEIVLENYTHSCCWLNDWPTLSRRIDAALGVGLLAP